MAITGGALAIDHGTKRTGFAYADALRISLNALEPFHGPGDAPAMLEHIAKLCDERSVRTFVVGLPYNMDGSEGPRAADVRAFGERLRARFPAVELVYADERLSSKEAEELLRESGLHGLKARALRDSFSALVVLRDWVRAHERS
ncbi:MAG: Holliday junction resolvase RuvX [Planctomycetes bacterium]|nr:Holliday junction resolvase RuvX [Planctomycetota bacterium]